MSDYKDKSSEINNDLKLNQIKEFLNNEEILSKLDQDTSRKITEILNKLGNVDKSNEESNETKESSDNKSKSKIVETRLFYETINPDDWEFDGESWSHKREIYTDQYQIREAGIVSINLDEEKMTSSNKDNLEEINKFIDDIYEKSLIKIVTGNIVGTFYYFGKERPKYPISVIISELPFLDCPASYFEDEEE